MIWTFLVSAGALIVAILGCALLSPSEAGRKANDRLTDVVELNADLSS